MLYAWELADLEPVIEELGLPSRKRGETAFPPLANIIERLKERTAQSHDSRQISLSASEEPVGHPSRNRPGTQATKVPALQRRNSIRAMGLDSRV
jgi:hypothetical protein